MRHRFIIRCVLRLPKLRQHRLDTLWRNVCHRFVMLCCLGLPKLKQHSMIALGHGMRYSFIVLYSLRLPNLRWNSDKTMTLYAPLFYHTVFQELAQAECQAAQYDKYMARMRYSFLARLRQHSMIQLWRIMLHCFSLCIARHCPSLGSTVW